MALVVGPAQYVGGTYELISDRGRKKKRNYAVEYEGIGDFLYDMRRSFVNYEYYYRFDPYAVTCIDADEIPAVRVFADSVAEWAEKNIEAENRLIKKYGISMKKIRMFAAELRYACDVAMEKGCVLVGFGD